MLRALCLIAAFTVLLAMPAAAAGADAQATLKAEVGHFITLLKDPRYAGGANKAEQDDKIWRVLDRAFDFKLVSRLAVGRGWRRFSPEQQEEFGKHFAKLLGDNYVKKIRQEYSNEKVDFVGQDKLADNRMLVKTEVEHNNSTFKVDYGMINQGGGWRVYDVKVEGVSLIKNYRSQFNQILLNHDPAYLIDTVKKKVSAS